MLVIDSSAARASLSIEQAIPLMAEALMSYSGGDATQPLRTIMKVGTDVFGSMPCHLPGAGFGLKAVVYKPDNGSRGLDTHQGIVVVFNPETGRPLAVVDASAVTAIRTPAASGAATAALARPDAGDLAILGSGVQARGHLRAMAAVRSLRRVRVWSRQPEHAERFRAQAAAELGIQVEVMTTVAAALAGADLVCTTLACQEPVVERAHLAAGAHVNAVGASFRQYRELTSAAVARCTVFADSRESAARESGDLLLAEQENMIGPDHVVAEIGEVLMGKHPGRQYAEEITMFKSLGLAVEDVAAGFAIAQRIQDQQTAAPGAGG